MPSPTAAPPAIKRRRLTAVLENPVAGSQQAHPRKKLLRL
jgi:hypothetical protein